MSTVLHTISPNFLPCCNSMILPIFTSVAYQSFLFSTFLDTKLPLHYISLFSIFSRAVNSFCHITVLHAKLLEFCISIIPIFYNVVYHFTQSSTVFYSHLNGPECCLPVMPILHVTYHYFQSSTKLNINLPNLSQCCITIFHNVAYPFP